MPISVLIVDDEDLIRMNLAAFLEDEGFELSCANSGEDALEMLAQKQFDVGIVDMRLPGINGNELILRANSVQPKMKFAIHTGSTEYRLPQGLRDLGLDDDHVFHKPMVDMMDVVVVVKRLLG